MTRDEHFQRWCRMVAEDAREREKRLGPLPPNGFVFLMEIRAKAGDVGAQVVVGDEVLRDAKLSTVEESDGED